MAQWLLRMGCTPDAVTVTGALGVVACSLWFFPRGELGWGAVSVAIFALFDALDGAMARQSRRTGGWGAFLDSTMDRLCDAAVFAGLVLYAVGRPSATPLLWAALACLVLGFLVSYVRARAEGLGCRADVGIAERADRLSVSLLATGLVGFLGWSDGVLAAVLWLVAAASAVTVGQRMATVRRQLTAAA